MKMTWIFAALVDALIVALWVKVPEFYTWHFVAVTVLGIGLGATFGACWQKDLT